MMSLILRLDCVISAMVPTTCATTQPPLAATSLAELASCEAWRAVSALWRTVLLSSSIEAAVCCRLLACVSVRWLRSVLPVAIWLEPVAMFSLLWRTAPTVRIRLSFMALRAVSNWAVSSLPLVSMCEVKSPLATACATLTARPMGSTTPRLTTWPMPKNKAPEIRAVTTMTVRARVAVWSLAAWAVLVCASIRSPSSPMDFSRLSKAP